MNYRKLTVGAYGSDVCRLHALLRAKGFELPKSEIEQGFFGPETRRAVISFQGRAGFAKTGLLDEKTAAALETPVSKHAPTSTAAPSGVVKPATAGIPASGRSPKSVILSPTGVTSVLPKGENGLENCTVDDPSEPWLRVYGVVRNEHGEPLDGVTVQAFDRDLRNEQVLGSTPAREGRYEIRYQRSQFRNAEKDSADLVMKVLGPDGIELYKTPVNYNVPGELELDITLQGATYKGPSEWETLTKTLLPLLENVSPLDLREDDQHQDLSFLAGETRNDRIVIGTWIACFRLADKSRRENAALEPEVLFGFTRQGQPSIFYDTLLQDLHFADRISLWEDKILRRLADITPDLQESLLEKAIADNIISTRVRSSIRDVLETLRGLRVRFATEGTFGGGKGTIGQLLDLNLDARTQQTKFMEAFTAHNGPMGSFWKKVEEDRVLEPEVVKQVKLSFELGAFCRNHIPLVNELVQAFRRNEITTKRDLARYDRAAWRRLFRSKGTDGNAIGVPANIDGDDEEARMEEYAAILERQYERAYPSTAFAAKLERAEQSPVRAKPDVVRFLNNNPGFHLDRFRVDQYLAQNENALQGIADKDSMLTELKAVQRIFKLHPTYQVVDALLARKIDSAQQIYFMGQAQFVKALDGTGINKIQSKRLYRKAENAYAMTLALFGDYNLALNGPSPFAVPSTVVTAETKAKIATLPNLQTLFGSLDYCECTHCRSVYSPSAYFVDIMRYLGERGTQGTGMHAGKNVRQVLLERRPDLGEIELSCENTNTPLPYIDLVNEILEDSVAPLVALDLNGAIEPDLVAGPAKPSVLDELKLHNIAPFSDAQVYAADIRGHWAVRDAHHAYTIFKNDAILSLLPTRQTHLSAAELRANPEYTNQDAYRKLKGEVFPLSLPFDLAHLQARAYLDHLGVPQPRLLQLFQQKQTDDVTLSPSDLQIDCAWLNLTETERQILTGVLPGRQAWEFWGLAETGNDIPHPENPADPTENITGRWTDVLSNVDVMLHRSGLLYKELMQLLDLQSVNPDGSIFIFDTSDSNTANCDTSKFTIRNLNEEALNRIHRFIRLWRKFSGAMWELDLLLPDVEPEANVTDKQITDAFLQTVSRMNRLREQLGLDWRVLRSLYEGIDHVVYHDRSQDGAPAVQTLYQRLFRNKLVDAVASFPASPDQITGTIADKVPGILAAFRIKEPDLTLILSEPDLGVAVTANLDAAILSRIHRITVLAHSLNLEIDPFLRLRRLWALDPFSEPGATLSFVALAKEIEASNFSVLELDYVLAHRFTANSGVALDDKTIISVIQAIRDGLQKISDDLHLKSEETTQAYVKSKLGLLPALQKDVDQVAAVSIIDGTWQGTPADRDKLIDTFFNGVLDLPTAKAKLAAIGSELTPAAAQTEVDKRFDYVQPELEAFLQQTQKEAFVHEKTAEVLRLDVPSANVLLTRLKLPGAAGTLLQDINDTRLLARLPDGAYQFELNETDFPDIFKSLRLLHKNALVIGKLQIKTTELTWWVDHGDAMGWMHPANLPITSITSPALDSWVAMHRFFEWKAGLPNADLTAFDFASQVLDHSSPSNESITDLARLTAWEAANIETLAAAFHWKDAGAGFDVIKNELKKSANLVRLAEGMRALRRLGVNASRAIQWARAEPSSADADSLKQTVKAKYDLKQWQQIIQPIQDQFREQKREALVSWLVAHPNQEKGENWSDPNGLYSYFLIDVGMCACMLTSRLKQAASSAQLFVQRCLLNLEVDILAKADLDPKWKQWKWMKQYRLWEANRKVFLYPENWIEPELRDEKSPFFKDLETELMQNDVTDETAEQAYRNYLEKLDKVANLEIRAMYHQPISQDESVLHVFARSRSSQSPEHFYRKRINNARWTAWEKVDPEIHGNHLIAGMHNRRLYLLWPQILDKADPPSKIATPGANSSTTIEHPSKYWEVRLFWTELKKGKWTPKVLSDSSLLLYQGIAAHSLDNIDFRVRLVPHLQIRMFVTDKPAVVAPTSWMLFDKLGKQLNSHTMSQDSNGKPVDVTIAEHIIAPPESHYRNNLIRHNTGNQYFYYGSMEESEKPHALSPYHNAETIRLLRKIDATRTYSVIDSNAKVFGGQGSFFVWDPLHTYFVDYVWRREQTYYSQAWHDYIVSSFKFFIHYHPFVELFIKELNIWGLKGLLNRSIQMDPASIPGAPARFNFDDYQPDNKNVVTPRPVEDVDFSYTGAYSIYNWELFFHVPFFIANKLSANQRFEEALEWFHYIFDPTSTYTTLANPDTPQQKFWITKPFYETTKADYYKQKIESIMVAIAKGDVELREQVREWRDNPFNPHLIARMRTVAYQKNVLTKYILVLIAWADQLFRQDTIESINEATQLYILAESILGPRPKSVPRKIANPVKTFYQLQQEGIDAFGNVLKELENLIPEVRSSGTMDDDAPELPYLDVLYFGIPNNERLLTLWDMVADRLFKIRHCMNIEGVERQLALFEPPIDPAILVKAVAAGLDVGAVLSDMNAPLPLYRFTFMIQRALDICNEVKSLGNAMLAALEKRDAEALALLRASHERIMLDQVRLIKNHLIDETQRTWDSLIESKKTIEERKAYYEGLLQDGLNTWESLSLVLTGGVIVSEIVGTVLNALGSGTSLIPEVNAGASGFGGSPHVTLTLGGKSATHALSKAADVARGLASILQTSAGMTATIGSYNRRAQEWRYQQRLAAKELPPIDKQIAAASIRQLIAKQDLINQDMLIENAQKEDDYQRTKFTNQELYDWMINQISSVYFQSYQLAYDIAKRAERCFRYELGLSDSNYIQFGYWDSLKKGLLAGERLHYDLRRLETAYYEQNRREYELTKHISLAQLDPISLLKLRQNGECFLDIPEAVFDMDYPGHYFRRLRTVGLSIPCVAGPYTTVACTLTLIRNHLRKDSTLLANKYERDFNVDDPRFRDDIAAIQSIATSDARNDHGMFELNFRDERYVPFEAAGAISSWHIKLNKDLPQFDFSTISDLIIHLSYTAREGGGLLRSKAVEELNKTMNEIALAENRSGLYRVFDLKREYSAKWSKFLHPANPAEDQALVLDDLPDRLPYFTRQFTTKKARKIEVVALMKDEDPYKVMLSPIGTTSADFLSLSPDTTYDGLHRAPKDLTNSEVNFDAWTFKLKRDDAADFKSLPEDAIKELFLIINYTIA